MTEDPLRRCLKHSKPRRIILERHRQDRLARQRHRLPTARRPCPRWPADSPGRAEELRRPRRQPHHARETIKPVPTLAQNALDSRRPAGPVAQWSEPAAHNRLVAGSSPAGPTTHLLEAPVYGPGGIPPVVPGLWRWGRSRGRSLRRQRAFEAAFEPAVSGGREPFRGASVQRRQRPGFATAAWAVGSVGRGVSAT